MQNLHRAVTTHTTDVEVLLTGVRMVLDQCTAGLEKLGLRPVPGVGAAFDPTLHEAIGIAPVEDAGATRVQDAGDDVPTPLYGGAAVLTPSDEILS